MLVTLAYVLRHWRETHGQDMIEYALMAGFLTISAGAAFPPVGNAISAIFSQVASSLRTASTQGS